MLIKSEINSQVNVLCEKEAIDAAFSNGLCTKNK